MTTARLLIVDDDRDNLELLTYLFGDKYRVFSYGCVREALEDLERAHPDLLLLDIGMRPVDGVQCLEAIRARPGYGNIPAMALTAYARDEERQAFLAAGFQAVVTKPVLDDRHLFATISELLASSVPTSSRRPSTSDPAQDQSVVTAEG